MEINFYEIKIDASNPIFEYAEQKETKPLFINYNLEVESVKVTDGFFKMLFMQQRKIQDIEKCKTKLINKYYELYKKYPKSIENNDIECLDVLDNFGIIAYKSDLIAIGII